MKISTALESLKAFFASRDAAPYLVGGYLRDSLLALGSKDVDVAVSGDAMTLARELADSMGGAFVALDPERGIARVVVSEEDLVVDVSSHGGDILKDLARRDFTIDAMALPLESMGRAGWQEDVLDPSGGRGDLSLGLIRMVSANVFKEDPLRLLRASRLARRLGFQIEKGTEAQVGRDAGRLSQVSGERVRDEFLALISLDNAYESLAELDDLGLLEQIIPELAIAKGVSQPKEHYWDVFEHIMQTVKASERVTPPQTGDKLTRDVYWDEAMSSHFNEEVGDGHNRRALLKLGALFHDIAKPQTKAVDATGRTRFLGHPTLGASMAQKRLRALRMSSRSVRSVGLMVEHHLRPTQMSQGVEMPTARATHRFYRELGDTAASVLYLSLADYLAARGPRLEEAEWRHRVAQVNHMLESVKREEAPERKERFVTGKDLMETFHLEPGPVYRTLLEGVEEARAAGEVGDRAEALEWIKTQLTKERGLEDTLA
jgi:putative nucleotidyltransferase with HDIG domain